MKQVLFVINSSRSLTKLSNEAIELCVASKQLNCRKAFTSKAKDAIMLAKEGAEDDAYCVVAVGGDGTCNEVLNGILSAKNRGVLMGIVPNGTGNDFYRMLGSFEPKRFVELLESQESKRIDVINVFTATKEQFALNIAGVGFDGFVVNMLNNQREQLRLGGKVSYALAILRSFILFKKPTIELESEEFNYKGKCLLVAACNGSTFGHGLVINPNARLDSGVLGVTLMGNVTLLDYLRKLGKLKKGIEINHPEVDYFETKEVKIKAPKSPLFSQVDGEYLSNESLTIKVLPGAINFLMDSTK